jgi:DNA (cytosine-5)-methyltransferase 1
MITLGSLFAGIGGFEEAFTKAGYENRWSNEYDENVAKTFSLNFDHLIQKPIEKVDFDLLEKVSVITSGFPCQPFSIGGKMQGFDDPRGNHFFNTLNCIEKISPDVFLLENVKNLMSHNKGNTWKTILEELDKTGYDIHHKVLNASDYGIPQNRERVYIVGFKNKFDFEWPTKNAFLGLVRDYLEPNVAEKYYYTPESKYYQMLDEAIDDCDSVYQIRRIYIRKNKSRVCPTIAYHMGTGGHNVPIVCDKNGYRKLTPRECFNLQGFPNSFKIAELSDSKLYQQIGNSIAIPVVHQLAKQIRKYFD